MTNRYSRKGKAALKFAATLTDATAPYSATRAEITGATDILAQMAEIGGMQYSNEPIDTPDMASSFDTQIPGADTTDPPTFTFYDTDEAAPAIRAALAKGTTGYILAFPQGDIAGRRMEIWPVQSTGVNDEWTAGNEPARYVATTVVTAPPTQNATVPAL